MKRLDKYEIEQLSLIEDYIKDSGYKLTLQRKEILMEFIKNSQKHLSGEDIYEKLKTKGIGISTVYRNIKLFTDIDILKEIKFEQKSYYELKMFAKKPLHIHFKCENCDKIIDIVDRKIILKFVKINGLIEDIYSSEIFDADIMLHGYCKDCKTTK